MLTHFVIVVDFIPCIYPIPGFTLHIPSHTSILVYKVYIFQNLIQFFSLLICKLCHFLPIFPSNPSFTRPACHVLLLTFLHKIWWAKVGSPIPPYFPCFRSLFTFLKFILNYLRVTIFTILQLLLKKFAYQ